MLKKILLFLKKSKVAEKQESQEIEKQSYRKKLYEFISLYANGDEKRINEMYILLYCEFKQKYKINLQRLAKSRGYKTIEYAEQENYIGRLYTLAYSMFGNQAAELMLEFSNCDKREA